MKGLKSELLGDSINLRKLKLSDAQDMVDYITKRGSSKWTLTQFKNYTLDDAKVFIRRCQKNFREKTSLNYGITMRGSDQIIGTVGLVNISWTHQCAELGYLVNKDYWGQGIATEASRLLVAYGFEQLKLYRVYALAFEANPASIRVMEKCGLSYEGIMREAIMRYRKRQSLLTYGILKPEFNQ